MNGVYRGSCYVRTERCPRSGTKNYYYTHNMSGGTVGFRCVNGGLRVGTSKGNARLYRNAYRQGYGRAIGTDGSVGFLCEWCKEGSIP